ncbi:hypothetical protein [Mesorhizobium sp. M7A.F.Ca.US.008.03.1.1]|uniref:hypothetical protein n=1 Tax=Mesorhizobium sp. M7A.F.Ca.US.008.03.1.1 TaxID=2496742 RepID=UPI000FCBB32A|nr:hypothetical protein [Mesorhizobium sp. M7A.F.Ca.US.008.03.1.1]RUW62298.1 hypothetical protein EOA16_08670 [Mesorhizobium sp. M7A.F.Ca.US.008.03.1.1]
MSGPAAQGRMEDGFVSQEHSVACRRGCFVWCWLLGIIVMQKDGPSPAKPVAALKPFDGKLAIPSVDDLRVGGRKILLCGAAFSRPQAMRLLVTEAARQTTRGSSWPANLSVPEHLATARSLPGLAIPLLCSA